MSFYPDEHHPVFFLRNALQALGADAVWNARDDRTCGCWGLIVNGRPFVWLIDNRWEHEKVKEDPAAAELLKRGALVCSAQKPDAVRIGSKWLPLAVTPGYRPPDKPVDKLCDVAFVGYIRDSGREQVLRHVARHFTLNVAQGVFGEAAVDTYWRAKVGLNVPTGYGSPTAYDSMNMRLPEILATGTPAITSYEPYLAELGLYDGKTCMTYANADQLLSVIDFLINKSRATYELMGPYAAQLAQSRHTYRHRAEQLLGWLK